MHRDYREYRGYREGGAAQFMKQRLLYMPARKGERGGGAPELEAHRFLYSFRIPAGRREASRGEKKRHGFRCTHF